MCESGLQEGRKRVVLVNIICKKRYVIMEEYESQVFECHQAMELDINSELSVHLLELRQKLLNEEMGELNVEIDNLLAELRSEGKTTAESRAKMLKELADLQYVLSGMVVALGLPMQEVFSRVHKSNMSKLVNGKVLKRADGKFLKGPNYQPPYLQDIA